MKKLIGWEKWVDPLSFSEEDIRRIESLQEESDDYEDMERSKYTPNHLHGQLIPHMYPVKMIKTQFGIFPVSENCQPGKIFNFWNIHTNFPLTEEVIDIIEETPGIETLDVYTRYRARISVGKMFKVSEVRRMLHASLVLEKTQDCLGNQEMKLELEQRGKIMSARENIPKGDKFWFIYMLKNGSLEVYSSNEMDNEFMTKFNLVEELRNNVGGYIYSYLDEEGTITNESRGV